MSGEMTPLDVLRQRGWTKGDYNDDAGQVCILGARNVAFVGDAQEDAISEAADDWLEAVNVVIAEQFPDRPSIAYRFNDHPDTTLADVELVLEKAQIRYDEQVSPPVSSVLPVGGLTKGNQR